jgi:hypothetical protein
MTLEFTESGTLQKRHVNLTLWPMSSLVRVLNRGVSETNVGVTRVHAFLCDGVNAITRPFLNCSFGNAHYNFSAL